MAATASITTMIPPSSILTLPLTPSLGSLSLADLPAMQPPPNTLPNFTNPPTLHPIVLSVAITTMTLITLVVTIRIFTKAHLMREMRAEEYFSLAALLGILLWDSIYIHVSVSGFSRHLWDVRLVDVSNFAYMSYLAEISYVVTMFAAKASILFQLRTLFCPDEGLNLKGVRGVFRGRRGRGENNGNGNGSGTSNPVFWAIHTLMFLNITYSIACLLVYIFQCTPRRKAWDLIGDVAREGSCVDVAAVTVVSAVVNLVLDLGILVVPICAIWRLRLSLRKRLGISAVFGVGGVTCGIAAVGVYVRLPLLRKGYGGDDLTWLISKVGIWTMVEYFGTILVGCMPSFPRFFLFLRGREPNTTHAASTAASGPNSGKGLGSRSTQPSIQIPPPVQQKKLSRSPSVTHYSNSPSTLTRPKGILAAISPVLNSSYSAASASPIGMALSTSEVSFSHVSARTSTETPQQPMEYIELEERRYSRDNGGHVGYASSLSGVISSCSDYEDEETRVGIESVGEYYDDMEEYWSGPAGRRSL